MKVFIISLLFFIFLFNVQSCTFPKRNIRYEVQCTKCLVAYTGAKDESAIRISVTGNWEYSFVAYEGQYISIAAANQDTLPDRVYVAIYLNNVLQDSLSKSGKNWSGASLKMFVE